MAGKRIVIPNYMPALDLTGAPVAGAKLYFYENETTTLATVYTSAALSVAHPNPVIASAAGVFPSIFADEGEEFSVAITDSSGSPISGLRNRDNVQTSLVYGSGVAETAAELPILAEGDGAVERALGDVWAERPVSVKDYGAVGNGVADDTVAFQNAAAANLGRQVFVPEGTYLVGNVGSLLAAGAGFYGAAGYNTIIKAKSGTTGAIFYNPDAADANGATAFGRFADLRFDLNGQDCIGIDLSHCDGFVVERVNGHGGADFAGAIGTLVKFGSPTDSSSYNNVVKECSGSYFAKAVVFGENANQNRVEGGSWTLNAIGIDCAPGGVLLRPALIGVRVEGNGVGVKEGAQYGVYSGYFENNTNGDFDFTTDSDHACIKRESTTASTSVPLTNKANATNLQCDAFGFGHLEQETSTSRARMIGGYSVHFPPAGSPWTPPNMGYSGAFSGALLMANNTALHGVNLAGTNTVIMARVGTGDEVEILGYNSATASYGNINIGGGASVRPIGHNATDLGTVGVRWKHGYFQGNLFSGGVLSLESASGVIYINSVQVLKSQQAAVADAVNAAAAPTQAEFNALVTQVNALLARLRAHGLIAT